MRVENFRAAINAYYGDARQKMRGETCNYTHGSYMAILDIVVAYERWEVEGDGTWESFRDVLERNLSQAQKRMGWRIDPRRVTAKRGYRDAVLWALETFDDYFYAATING